MERKVKIINIERNEDGLILFRKWTQLSSLIDLAESHVFYPGIITQLDISSIDLVVVDTQLPCNIADFVRDLKTSASAKIIVACDFVQPDLIFNCLRSGAVGYLEKFCDEKHFEQVLSDCMDNLIALPLSIMSLHYTKSIVRYVDPFFENIFSLLSQGFTTDDITRLTGMTQHEIKSHLFLTLHR